jgi:AraC-like DNA-binding protein
MAAEAGKLGWRGTAMSSLISTDHVPPADRLDYAREALRQTMTAGMEIEPLTEERFRLEVRYRDLGATRISVTSATSHRVRRAPAPIDESDADVLCVGLGLRGSCTFEQYDRQFSLPRFDLFLWDGSRSFSSWLSTRAGRMEYLALQFPRALLPMPADRLHQLMAVRLPAVHGTAALTSQLLVRLATEMDHFTPAEAARLSTAALDVLAVLLARELDGDRWVPPETHKHALLVRIHAFIQERLGDPELSPGVIADAHHISPRYLHMLFRDEGATVASWIRQRRLERSRRDLGDPALASHPVARIATRWGFSSASHFSQAFRAAYGMPPQEYRQQVLLACHNTVRES